MEAGVVDGSLFHDPSKYRLIAVQSQNCWYRVLDDISPRCTSFPLTSFSFANTSDGSSPTTACSMSRSKPGDPPASCSPSAPSCTCIGLGGSGGGGEVGCWERSRSGDDSCTKKRRLHGVVAGSGAKVLNGASAADASRGQTRFRERTACTGLTSERHAPANRHPLIAAYLCHCNRRLLCPRPRFSLI